MDEAAAPEVEGLPAALSDSSKAAALRSTRLADRFVGILAFCACGVTLQLLLLAHLNYMQPLYSVASVMSVMGMALLLRRRSWLAAYFVAVAGLCLVLYSLEPDPAKLVYWGGALPLVVLVYYRQSSQGKAERREREDSAQLERRVEERTGELLRANQRLQTEMLQREHLEQELRIVQKMEAVGRLTGGIAHEFNNLITTITVYSELMRAQLPADAALVADLNQIETSAAEAAALVRSLLSVARAGTVHTQVVDLNQLVSEMAELIRHLLGERSELALRLSQQECRTRANLDQLHQVLINLVLNAREAMEPRGGRLVIEVAPACRDSGPTDEPPVGAADTRYVTLRVADDGVGMDADTRERVFDPFFSTKEASRGTGLGLSTVYGIVKQCGGHLRLSSAPGDGSCFDLFFPLTSEAVATPGSAPSGPEAQRGSERILLVEDEDELRGALQRVLAYNGYRVTVACDGRAALDVLKRSPEGFELVVSDVVMPRMSGIELVEELISMRSPAKVLLLSGYLGHPSVQRRAFPRDAEFLAKPFAPADFTAKVRCVLDGV